MNLYLSSIIVFLAVILLLVVILLVAKNYLVASGKVKVTINGDKELEVNSGASLLSTLAENGVYLPSACGGKGSCGQCKCQVVEGGGEILDSEKGHFTRKQIKDNWRLGCQCKVKGDRGYLQQERGYLHQGVHRAASSRRAHGLPARKLCPDQDSCILYGLQ